jgi:peptidyl-prolyl cis-trans isomerase C
MSLKMKNIIIIYAVMMLAACGSNTEFIEDNSRVLVKVGDKPITEKYLQAYLFNRGVKDPTKEQLDQGLDALIKQQAMLLQAEKQGLKLSPEQQLSIKQVKEQALSQLAVQHYLDENPVTDDEIRAEYDRIIEELQGTEYKVRHMLFQDEVQALAHLDKISAGQSYLDIEEAYLQEFSQIRNVGDIGWINIKQVPEAFHEPLKGMKKAQVYSQVVISQYGAHVLYLEDKRASEPPAFETVKDGIKKSLIVKSKNRFEQIAMAKAKVAK